MKKLFSIYTGKQRRAMEVRAEQVSIQCRSILLRQDALHQHLMLALDTTANTSPKQQFEFLADDHCRISLLSMIAEKVCNEVTCIAVTPKTTETFAIDFDMVKKFLDNAFKQSDFTPYYATLVTNYGIEILHFCEVAELYRQALKWLALSPQYLREKNYPELEKFLFNIESQLSKEDEIKAHLIKAEDEFFVRAAEEGYKQLMSSRFADQINEWHEKNKTLARAALEPYKEKVKSQTIAVDNPIPVGHEWILCANSRREK